MTREEVLAQVREMRPGAYQDELLLSWLDEIEERIKHEVLAGYEQDDLPEGGELLAPSPYCALYRWWLICQIDLSNAETDRYNADYTTFFPLWTEYEHYVSRTHKRTVKSDYKI